ncbi:MAG: phosphodiester glycosidase family protein, partial [Eubacteriales bacterium]
SLLPISSANIGTVTSQTVTEIVPGYTYTNTVSEHSAGPVQGFTLEVSPSSTVYPISVQGSGTIYGGGNILKAIEVAEAQGYNVVGAINTDYFQTSTGVPLGVVIEDGVYKSSAGNYGSLYLSDTTTPTVFSGNHVGLSVTNLETGYELVPHYLNKNRDDIGGVYLMTEHFSTVSTRTSTDGISVRLVPTSDYMVDHDGELRINQEMELIVSEVVTGDSALYIGDNNFILTSATASGMNEWLEQFKVGDRVSLSAETSQSAIANAQWATGTGDVMIDNGALTYSGSWAHISEGRAPRSAVGMKADGTLVFYVADGRQTGYSVGLSQADLANHFMSLGCVWAANLDGGGSSTIALTTDVTRSPSLYNSPSDGAMRSVATYLLLVDPQIPTHLTLSGSDSAVLVGSTINLGSVSSNDVNGTEASSVIKDSVISGNSGLGSYSSSVDWDGKTNYKFRAVSSGTESISISSASLGLTGAWSIRILDYLTGLSITQDGVATSLISVAEGNGVLLSTDGFFGDIPVVYDDSAVSWEVSPVDPSLTSGMGYVTQDGYFVGGSEDSYVTATVAGQSATILAERKTAFTDVPKDHWSYGPIDYLYEQGIVNGTGIDVFGFGREIRRCDFVLILYGALGKPAVNQYTYYDDVPLTHYAFDAISWAAEHGIASGVGTDLFGTDRNITREQAFTMLYKALGSFGFSLPTTSLSTADYFADHDSISSYALQSISTFLAHDLFPELNENFDPKDALTREWMATLIYDLLHFTPEAIPDSSVLSLMPTEITLGPDQYYTLTPMLEPAGSGAHLTWRSSDPSAVEVSSSGVITNVFQGTGQPVVTVSVSSGSLSASIIVRCEEGSSSPDTSTPDTSTPDTTPSPTLATGTVINAPSGLNVRTSPSSSAEVITMIGEGSVIALISQPSADWYQVSFQQANDSGLLLTIEGYVMAQYISTNSGTTTPPSASTGRVDADSTLNLRSGADTTYPIIVQLAPNTPVVILSSQVDWYQIECVIDGLSVVGYVASKYIVLD